MRKVLVVTTNILMKLSSLMILSLRTHHVMIMWEVRWKTWYMSQVIFLSFLFFLWLCASWMSLPHLVGAEAVCNCYLPDIKIFLFLEKNVNQVSWVFLENYCKKRQQNSILYEVVRHDCHSF